MSGPNEIPIVIAVDPGDSVGMVQGVKDEVVSLGDAATITAGALDKLSAAADGAFGGQGKLATSTEDSTVALEDQAVAARTARDALLQEAEAAAAVADSNKAMATSFAETAALKDAAVANLGGMYVGMSKIEALGTPAILKAATWSILGVGGIAYEGIKQYMNFNKLITQTITQAGVNPSQMGALSSMAENISKLTGVKLTDVANSLYRVASGTASWNNGLGASMKQLTNITTAVTKLQVLGAIPSGAASEQSARVISAMINSDLIGTGRNPNQVAALVNATVGSGDMRQNDLVPGIGRGVLQSAKANGMSAKDMMAWIASLTSMGTTASVAGNYVKTGINLLANPSAQGVLAEAMIGIHPGEMQTLISGKGGLQAAVATFDAAMRHFAPSKGMVSYRTPEGFPRPQSPGEIGAINKLQTWMVGEMPAEVLKQWEHGGSAASGGLTAKNAQWVEDLIMTKAFGGSKQFATLAAILKNPQLLAGVEKSIGRKDSLSYLSSSTKIAENTPSQRFDKALAALTVDLVNAGRVMYPAVIKIVDAFTWFIGKFVSWKPAIYELGALMTAVVAAAGLHKAAQLGKGIMGIYGGFLTHMSPNGTGGAHFRNIYATQTGKPIADLGKTSIEHVQQQVAATEAEAAKIVTSASENTDRMLAAESENTTRLEAAILGSRGGGSGGGRGGSVGSAVNRARSAEAALQSESAAGPAGMLQMRDPATGRLLSYAKSQEMMNAESMASYYGYAARGTRARAFGKTGGFISNEEMQARASRIASLGTANNGMTSSLDQSYSNIQNRGTLLTGQYGMEESMANITTRGVAADASLAANGISTVAADSGGLLSRIGGSAMMDMAGGPAGMAMMLASLLPMAMPAIMSGARGLFSTLGSFFGAKTVNLGHANVGNVHTLTSTNTQLANVNKAIKAAHYNAIWATAAQTKRHEDLINERNILTGRGRLLGKHPLAAYTSSYNIENDPAIKAAIKATKSVLPGTMGMGGDFAASGSSQAEADRALLVLLKHLPGPARTTLARMIHNATHGGKLGRGTASQFQAYVHDALNQYVTKAAAVVNGAPAQVMDRAVHGWLAGQETIHKLETSGQYATGSDITALNTHLRGKGRLSSANEGYDRAEAIRLSRVAAHERELAKTVIDPVARHQIQNNAKTVEKMSLDFTKAANEIVNKEHHVQLSPQSVNDVGSAMVVSMQRALAGQDLSATSIGNSVANGIKSSASSIAGMINGANARTNGTGGKGPKK